MRRNTVRCLVIGGLLAVLSVALVGAIPHLYVDPDWRPRWMIDFSVYLAGGEAVRHGISLYAVTVVSPVFGPLVYTYPPFDAAVIFAPLSWLPLRTAYELWNVLAMIALAGVVWLTLGVVGLRRPWPRAGLTALCLALSVALVPVGYNFVVGQINTVIVLLVLLDFRRPAGGRWQGVGVGLAAAIKITPLIFIGYFLLTRRWRAALTSGVSFLVTVAIGFAVRPADSLRYWGGLLFDPTRVGGSQITCNQSISGLFARLFHSTHTQLWWLPVLLVVAAYGLAVATMAHRSGDDFFGMLLTAVTGLLVTPISWEHHWMYVVPLLIWLGARAYQRRSVVVGAAAAALAFVCLRRWYMTFGVPPNPPVPLALDSWQQLTASGIAICGLVLLAVTPVWLRHAEFRAPSVIREPVPSAA